MKQRSGRSGTGASAPADGRARDPLAVHRQHPAAPSGAARSPARGLLFALFTASGFAGLIYESIWTHYLKLFLGHAAYAQTLVLAIFMGGMALGSWLSSRWSPRWRDLLAAYAATEAAIGLLGLVFHEAFTAATGLAFEAVLRAWPDRRQRSPPSSGASPPRSSCRSPSC